MIASPDAALQYSRQHHDRFLDDLSALVRIPSVSTDPAAHLEMQRAAYWVADRLRSLDMENVSILPTAGEPVVVGEWLKAGPARPTVLIYGHYDVQPAEPLELWRSPAFELTPLGDYVYGRGASDMKGQVIASLAALEALLRTDGLPINVRFLIEGEEEIGSPNLKAFIQEHKDRLACDFVFNPDAGMLAADIPTITYGLRGLAYFEIRLSGPSQDLHSGLFGGAIHNPAQVLCDLIAGMHDAQGRVTLPGFYQRVLPMDQEERQELARLPSDDVEFLRLSGSPGLFGEAGFTAAERVCARPTLEVNGLLSGFTNQGQKTVLPAKAMAKISMRLVPDQDPEEVYRSLLQYLEDKAPATVRWEVIKMAGESASITDRYAPSVNVMRQALQATWGKPPVFRREGGSIPVVSQMQKILGVDSVLTGFGLPDDQIHAPNERMHLPTFFKGIEAFTRFFYGL